MALARDVTTVGGNVGVVASLELLGVARVRDLIAAIHRR